MTVSGPRLLAIFFSLQYFSAFGASTGQNGFSFASYYNDHMVLQKAPAKSNVWGYSSKIGDTVHLTISNNQQFTKTVETKVVNGPEGKGTWKVTLPPISAGGPYHISVKSSLATLTITDVLFGDVWICSGQSNMQFTLSMDINGSQKEIDNGHNFPDIRLFTIHQKESTTKKYDLIDVEQHWALPSQTSLKSWDWGHFSAVCWHFGKQLYQTVKHPIGLIATDWGGTLVESWSSPDAMAKCGSKMFHYGPQPGFPRDASVIWNSMIHPLLPFTIYGVVWYQGESNWQNPQGYTCSFPAMIDDWREKFHTQSGGQTSKNFPFGFVQLGTNQNNDNSKGGMVEVRISQTAGYGYVPNKRMSNTFMAVAMDLPDFKSPIGSIHPRHKEIVGKRLSYGALSIGYQMPGAKFQGPFPSKITNNKGASTLTIVYDNYKTDLDVRNNDGFEICCSNQAKGKGCGIYDGSWHKVKISSSTKHSVTLPYPSQCHQNNNKAHALRYEWRESPCPFEKCAIYSVVNRLPAPPFQQYLEEIETHIIG